MTDQIHNILLLNNLPRLKIDSFVFNELGSVTKSESLNFITFKFS